MYAFLNNILKHPWTRIEVGKSINHILIIEFNQEGCRVNHLDAAAMRKHLRMAKTFVLMVDSAETCLPK